jgi:glycerol-3-phosphate O-acyltransferase
MEKELNFDHYLASVPLDKKQALLVKNFYHNFKKAGLENGYDEAYIRKNFKDLITHLTDELKSPSSFDPYHQALFSPIDYYQFGLDFMEILVDKPIALKGTEHLKAINQRLLEGHNVILLANHQTEADPQLISLALQDSFPEMAKKMIFVAGERVITDPLAVPFSKGRYLLCIYSKRYIDIPPELKLQKQLHNKKTMEQMGALLKEGGKIIYVAPSGGRDRKDESGNIQVAPFDPQSIEMFILMAKRAGTPTHFHTLALSTYNLLPPPDSIQINLGEDRHCNKTKIGFYFGGAIDLEKYAHISDKHSIRQERAKDLTEEVSRHYKSFV